jgi:two-component system response regulator RegX3
MTAGRILLVEDEESISEPLGTALRREAFETVVAATVEDGLAAFRTASPDLVLLDLMLPDGDGRDVLRHIRGVSRTPVIVLTARGDEMEKVVGLELGADDYVVKPFGAAEVVARIRAVLRRTSVRPTSAPSAMQVGDVRVDLDTHAVTLDGVSLELTLKEFELLRMLVEHAGTVVSRDALMDEVWDPHWYGSTKTLDVHVSSLRRKLGDDPARSRYIRTVRGVGFRFSSPAELGGAAG